MAKRRRPTSSRTTRSGATQDRTPQDKPAGEDTLESGATGPDTRPDAKDSLAPATGAPAPAGPADETTESSDSPDKTTETSDLSDKSTATSGPAKKTGSESTDDTTAGSGLADDTMAFSDPPASTGPTEDATATATGSDASTDRRTTDAPDTASTGEAESNVPRTGWAANRADDDGMPPVDESEADALRGSARRSGSASSWRGEDDGVSPETGDFSVAPVEDGPSAQGEPASAVPETPHASGSRTHDDGSGPAPAARETVVERRGGFVPMLLGGVAAAAIGFGLSQYLGPNGWPFSNAGSVFEDETRTALGETQSGLEDTRTGLEGLGARIDAIEGNLGDADFGEMQQIVATLTSAVDEIRAEIEGLDAAVNAMNGTAGTLADRVTAIEKAPMEDAVSPETVAAYERELEALQARVDEQNASSEQAAADRQAQMEETFAGMQAEIQQQRDEIRSMVQAAQSAEQDAQRQAQLGTLRSAAADLLTAVRSGDPFANALQPLSEAETVTVPEALSASAEDGVPTQAELVDSYPEAARAGLAAARSEDGGTGLQAFVARQLGARSVTPQDGESPDAILSRAEAAVNGGDIQAALDEISALPQAAQDAMSDWIGQARTRAEAVAAADGLVQELNQQ